MLDRYSRLPVVHELQRDPEIVAFEQRDNGLQIVAFLAGDA
jgi:hypothetical protein